MGNLKSLFCRVGLFWFRLNLPCLALLATLGSAAANPLVVELESLAWQHDFPPFAVLNDPNASAGQYIMWPGVNNGHTGVFTPGDNIPGKVRIKFNLTANANVQFAINVNMPNGNDDSFWYKLDNGNWRIQNSWRTSGWGIITPTTFNNVAAGDHTLRILRREDGSALDYVSLTASTGSITQLKEEVNLTVDKSVSDEEPAVGDTIIFTLTVSNSGPDDAEGAQVEDIVPSGFGNLQAVSVPTPSSLSIAGNTVLWTDILVPASSDTSATFSAEVLPP